MNIYKVSYTINSDSRVYFAYFVTDRADKAASVFSNLYTRQWGYMRISVIAVDNVKAFALQCVNVFIDHEALRRSSSESRFLSPVKTLTHE